jgi:hypothetical protein
MTVVVLVDSWSVGVGKFMLGGVWQASLSLLRGVSTCSGDGSVDDDDGGKRRWPSPPVRKSKVSVHLP